MLRRVFVFCPFLLICSPLFSQPLDWTGDMTIFGTTQSESRPVVAVTRVSGVIRAMCAANDSTLCMKRSRDHGAYWDGETELTVTGSCSRSAVASDDSTVYALISAPQSSFKLLYRLKTSDLTWSGAASTDVAPNSTGRVLASAVETDWTSQITDCYVNMGWIESEAHSNVVSVWFAQSRDGGASVRPERQVCTQTADVVDSSIALAVARRAEEKRVLIAAALDRPGTIDEAVRVFSSEDEGETWGESATMDSTAWPQREPTIASAESTVVLAYTRRVNAAAQHDLWISYSPDGGISFSPPYNVTQTPANETTPRLVADDSGERFYLFYLSGNDVNDSATVCMRTALVSTPWLWSDAILISEPGAAVAGGGLSVAVGPRGIAVTWTGRFMLGDTDIRFDASWRGTGANPRGAHLPTGISLGAAFPNPFNGETILPLMMDRTGEVTISIFDIAGRLAMQVRSGVLGEGVQQIPVDCSRLSSGVYFATAARFSAPPVKLILIR
jgi:hypothetical protein